MNERGLLLCAKRFIHKTIFREFRDIITATFSCQFMMWEMSLRRELLFGVYSRHGLIIDTS